jgi:hypothetical protein
LFSPHEEHLDIKDGTTGFVIDTWGNGRQFFVDILTTDGITLQGIPYHLVEFAENYPYDKNTESSPKSDNSQGVK